MTRRVGRHAVVCLVPAALAAVLSLHLRAQDPTFTISDLVGQQGPADPLPSSWTLNPPFALSPTSLFRRPDGRIHVTARAQNLSLDLPANYASQLNTSATRLNPFSGTEELLEPMVTVEGTCWERAGSCDYVVDAATCTVVERDHGTGALQRITGGACQSSTPDGQSRLNARYPFITAVGYQSSQGLLIGTCTSSSAIYLIQPGANTVQRIAGTGVPGYDLDNVPATTARIDCPRGIIETAYVPGNPGATEGIVFAEFANNIVRRVNGSGIIRYGRRQSWVHRTRQRRRRFGHGGEALFAGLRHARRRPVLRLRERQRPQGERHHGHHHHRGRKRAGLVAVGRRS